MSYTKFTFKEFRVCVRAVFAFGAGYKLGERRSNIRREKLFDAPRVPCDRQRQ